MPPKTQRLVIPTTLPTLKADLQVLCKKHNLDESGTVAELRSRLEEERDGPPETSTTTGRTTRPATKATEADLKDMRMAGLKDLADKLHVDYTSLDRAELVEAIIKAQETGAQETSDDGWGAALSSYAPKLKLPDLELDWGVSSLLLTPVLWPVLMWREPIGRAEVYGPLGTHGRMLEALAKRWTTLLGASDESVFQLTTRWTTLWALVSASRHERPTPTPRQWMRENHEHQVLPLTRLMLELQSSRARAEGQSKLAQRLKEVASVPTERLGYDVQAGTSR